MGLISVYDCVNKELCLFGYICQLKVSDEWMLSLLERCCRWKKQRMCTGSGWRRHGKFMRNVREVKVVAHSLIFGKKHAGYLGNRSRLCKPDFFLLRTRM